MSTLGANIATIADSISNRLKNGESKKTCLGTSYKLSLLNGSRIQTYIIDLSTYTTGQNCDTTANKNNLSHILQQRLPNIAKENWTEWCFALNNGGTWHGDVRLALLDDAEKCSVNTWAIPCQETK